MEALAFIDVLKVCQEFIDNPTGDTLLAFEDLKKKITVKTYLTMQEKVIALYRVLMDADKSTDLSAAVFTAGLEIALLLDGLLAYTNIDSVSIPKELKIYESFDAICQSGLADYIQDFCDRDYRRLVGMMERSVAYQNLLELVDSISRIQPEPIKETLDEFKKFRETASPELLRDMADIMRFNDPHLYQIKEGLVDDALTQLERIDKAERADTLEDAMKADSENKTE